MRLEKYSLEFLESFFDALKVLEILFHSFWENNFGKVLLHQKKCTNPVRIIF